MKKRRASIREKDRSARLSAWEKEKRAVRLIEGKEKKKNLWTHVFFFGENKETSAAFTRKKKKRRRSLPS